MIIVRGSIQTTSENLPEVLRLSLDHVQRSRIESGCISHSAAVDAENQCKVVFYEEWRDMPALQKHFEVPESKSFVQNISLLSISSPQIRMFNASEVG